MPNSASRFAQADVRRPGTVLVILVAAVLAGAAGLAVLASYPVARSAIGTIVVGPNSHNPRLDLRDAAIITAVFGAVTLLVAAASLWLLLRPRRNAKTWLVLGWVVAACGQLLGIAGGSGDNWHNLLPAYYPPLQYGTGMGVVGVAVLVIVLLALRPTTAYLDAAIPATAGADQQVFDLKRVSRKG
ncbi:hypothetical protein Athai_34650 [Actinocatenispora thailandica]|uniref:Uncharacterized protein n=1 Tax=Actinocatenispora thailandica TaxID=227318 RepID=A0A7R7HX98_9ACTN|nr:hypothetical protein [Actinocatenispora thailandica]BCJ35962.1 hypothetical protein Athai_34650 [Actinocatenispora thailandica]